jgi:8-oxo-dGTP diphosphatase
MSQATAGDGAAGDGADGDGTAGDGADGDGTAGEGAAGSGVDEAGPGVVRAGGGVVWRPDGRGGVEVLIAHRPRRADWSFPKGKAEPGEGDTDCALREVEEETGYRCRLGPDLGRVHYRDHRDRPKVVRWWAMTVDSGAFVANDEVDEVRWLAASEAAGRLSWATDREVLRRFEALGLHADVP